jgi:hypothetical protein
LRTSQIWKWRRNALTALHFSWWPIHGSSEAIPALVSEMVTSWFEYWTTLIS